MTKTCAGGTATDVCCNDFVLSLCVSVAWSHLTTFGCCVFYLFFCFFVFFVFLQPDDCVGHVGVPIDNGEVRLVDAPECDYLTTDKLYPRGEIQIRGMSLMSGHFKNEAATAKTLSKDGWLIISTGDIGRTNPNNTISIIDGRKNLFKLSSGEYIASRKVEAQYTKVPSVAQSFVYANSQKSF